jgi:hypothetical protein
MLYDAYVGMWKVGIIVGTRLLFDKGGNFLLTLNGHIRTGCITLTDICNDRALL